MTTALGRLVKAWLVPGSTTLLLLALALGVVLLYGGPLAWRLGRLWLALVLVAYLVLATPAVANGLLSSLQGSAGSLTKIEEARGASVLVVLGNGAVGYRQGDLVVHYLLRRTAFCVLEAARLHALLKPSLVILSGGPPPQHAGDLPEAEVMRRELLRQGVPDDVLLVEGASRNTAEQADNVVALLRPRNVTHIVLVTTPGHVERATALLVRRGIDVTPSVPLALRYGQADDSWWRWVPSMAALRGSESAMYEYLAIIQARWQRSDR
jgi:uncharacterized SAM-binding protein YcdF (DUF218 family)